MVTIGSSELSCQKASGRREAWGAEKAGFCLGRHSGIRGYGPSFPQRPSSDVSDCSVEQANVPSVPLLKAVGNFSHLRSF